MSAGTGKAKKKSKVQVKMEAINKRPPNFHIWGGRQDVLISLTFVHVSENPTVRVDQKPAADFWRHVQSVFQACYSKDHADVQVDGS
jgi:hypothetical protein